MNNLKMILKLFFCVLVSASLAACNTLVKSRIRDRLADVQEKQDALLSSEKMHLFLLGTGGPMPNETRDNSGVAVIAGGIFILVDVGPGVVNNMNLSGLPAGKISALFLTHYHSDHISDMGELDFMTWARGELALQIPISDERANEYLMTIQNEENGIKGEMR